MEYIGEHFNELYYIDYVIFLMLMTYLFRWKITCYTLFFITLAWFLLVGSGIVPEYFLGKLQQAYLAKPECDLESK